MPVTPTFTEVTRPIPGPASVGSQRKTVFNVSCTGNYSTTRIPCTPANLGLAVVEDANVQIMTPVAGPAAVSAVYDIANQRIQLNTATAEVSTGDTLSTAGLVLQVTAYGRLP